MISKGTNNTNKLFYADMTKKENAALKSEIKFTPLVDDFIGLFNYVYNQGSKFYFETNYKAPMMRIISFDLNKPEKSNW